MMLPMNKEIRVRATCVTDRKRRIIMEENKTEVLQEEKEAALQEKENDKKR